MRTIPHRRRRSLAGAIAVTLGAGVIGLAADRSPSPSVDVEVAATGSVGALLREAAARNVVPVASVPDLVQTAPPTPTEWSPAPATPAPAAPTPRPAEPPAPPKPAPAPPPQPRPKPQAAPQHQPEAEPQPASAESRESRVRRAYEAGVPAAWRQAISARFEIIDGEWSWARTDGLIQVAASHADGGFDPLLDLLAHEFGHLIAYRYGTREYTGAPPTGWPAPASRPEEAWADCVQRSFTGRATATHGQAPCGGEPLRWTIEWLAKGPGAQTPRR